MDDVSSRILRTVREYNESGRDICFSDLRYIIDAAAPTVSNKINDLIDDGELVSAHVQTPKGTKKLLYVSDRQESRFDTVKRYQEDRKIYAISRIATALEALAKTKDRKPEQDDGTIQTDFRKLL